jgi:hypothetical protein
VKSGGERRRIGSPVPQEKLCSVILIDGMGGGVVSVLKFYSPFGSQMATAFFSAVWRQIAPLAEGAAVERRTCCTQRRASRREGVSKDCGEKQRERSWWRCVSPTAET